jgi:uncharacterized protein
MSFAETLYRLQLLDTEIDVIRRRVFEIDQHGKGTPALTHTRAEAAAAEEALKAAEAVQAQLEVEAESLDEKISGEDKRLYDGAIKNPKELLEVEAEVASLKRRRAGLDEQLLGAMERIDTARADAVRCRIALQQAETNHASDIAAHKVERKQIIAKLTGQAEQRAALVAALPKGALDQYQALRTKKSNGIAVTEVRGGVCGGCGEIVSSSAAQQAHTGSGLALCSNCGRILYAA